MTPKEERDIREFILKEDERFSLVKLGFFQSVESEIEFISSSLPSKGTLSFKEWKKKILEELYLRRDFAGFFKENATNIFFERAIKSLFLIDLKKLFSLSEQTDIDKYLAPIGDTISYSLSPDLFKTIYLNNYCGQHIFNTTKELDDLSKSLEKAFFPLTEEYVIDELEKNENFYWEKIYLRLKPMAAGFSFQMSGLSGEENIHDLWSDTCFVLNSAVVEKRLQQPAKARDIISYAVGIIKNKNKEFIRKKKKNPQVDIDSISYKVSDDSQQNFFDNPSTIPSNFPSQEEPIFNYIDTSDEESVRNYMIVVLYNEEHPLHSRLVEGYQDKVQLLFEHYLDNLSYEEIVVKHYGEVDEEEMIRTAARIRQDVKRVKERLIKRFDSIITKPR